MAETANERIERRSPAAPLGRAVTVAFTVTWALAHLFDKGWFGHWRWSPTNLALVAACGWLLLAPRSARALLAVAVAQVADWFSDQSVLGNHPLLMTAVNAQLLVAALRCGPRRAWRDDDGAAVLSLAAPGVRIGVVAIYLWATFHKCNSDFLAIETSCVSSLAVDPRSRPVLMPLLPTGPAWLEAGIHATLAIEFLIPALLLFRPTRGAGILLAIWFHSFLSSGPRCGFLCFSVAIFPLLWLFASEASMARLGSLVRRVVGTRIDRSPATIARAAGLLALVALSLAAGRLGMSRVYPAWVIYDLVVLAWSVGELRRGIRALGDGRGGLFRPADPVLAIVPLVIFLNGATPYLGLKTETSYAMFSNLRTEAGRTNHLLVPAGHQPFGFQTDTVEVLDSSDRTLREIAGKDMLFTWFDLRRRAWMRPEMSLTFVRDGTVVVVDRVGDRPELVPPVPWWLGRLMPFRPFEREGPRGCDH